MKRLIILPTLSLLFLLTTFGSIAQEPRIFDLVKRGDFNELKAYLDTARTSVNVLDINGYSPLHVLIENFEEVRNDLTFGDSYKMKQNSMRSDSFRSCLLLLLEKGASTTLKSPEGWNALQYAVMKGKWQPVSLLLQKAKGGDVRDREGNTLLHLSLLINPDEPREDFWELLRDGLRSYDIYRYTPNYKGQTPITFYLSQPRCNPPASGTATSGKLFGATTPTSKNPCRTNRTSSMLSNFNCEECTLTPDIYGKKAKDYAEMHHKWYTFSLNSMENKFSYYAEINKKYEQVAERNKRATEEYLRKLAEWEVQGSKLDISFTRTYYYECNAYQKSRIKMDDPVVVTVTPDHISVTSLMPHYGRFKVESSKYEVIDGNEWMIFYLEKTATNSTYKAIGFFKNGCMIVSSYGDDFICY